MDKSLIIEYNKNKEAIRKRLAEFKSLNKQEQFREMIFCLLTPQSNAKKCWEAVLEIDKLDDWNKKNMSRILRKKTRFHNNKTNYVMEAKDDWDIIKREINNNNIIELRNHLAENIKGFGLKEASHFLRNIGKSDNKIAILDRHILRNLKSLNVIEEDRIKSKKHYLEMEQKFIDFSKQINIPIDHLDLLFWSKENGEIFK